MRHFSAFEGIPGISEAVFGDTDGRLIEAKGGFTAANESAAALGAVLCRQVASLSSALRLGLCEMLVIRTGGNAGVILFRGGCVAHLEMEAKRLSPEMEAKLRALDWVSRRNTSSASSAGSTPAPRVPPPLPARDNAVVKTRGQETVPAPAPSPSPPPEKRSETDGVPVAPLSGQTGKTFPPTEAPRKRITGAIPSVASDAVFAGDLGTISLPDVLEFCRNGQRTGTVVLRSGDQAGTVMLRRGLISLAVSPKSNSATMLARLTDKGKLSPQQIRSVKAAEPPLVAQRLVESGLMEAQAVRELLMEQVQRAVDELLDWVDGRFAFHPTTDESGTTDIEMLADPQVILLSIFKERDEKDRDQAAL